MGPRFNGVEDGVARESGHIHHRASMGPRFNGVEDLSPRSVGSNHSTGFNGATL